MPPSNARANPALMQAMARWSGVPAQLRCSSRRAWSGTHATAQAVDPEQVGLVRAWIDQARNNFSFFKNNAALKRNSTRQFF